MTTNASFKKRVRARMAKTGEKYGAARRILLEQAAARRDRGGWRPNRNTPMRQFGRTPAAAGTSGSH